MYSHTDICLPKVTRVGSIELIFLPYHSSTKLSVQGYNLDKSIDIHHI